MLLLKLQLPDLRIDFIVICDPQLPVKAAEFISDLLLGVELGTMLFFSFLSLLLLCLPLLFPA
jgi:hypothetical protein